MKVLIATVQVPFLRGGAELLTEGLHAALRRSGHQVDTLALPFRFSPLGEVVQSMRAWQQQDWSQWDAGRADRLIALRFPAFHVQHPDKRVWLLHQHRAIYELWNTPFGESADHPPTEAWRDEVMAADTRALKEARAVYTIARNVSRRLERYNQVPSRALYHPPFEAERFHHEGVYPFILCPSRLESLKRQDLLIRAMVHVPEPVTAYIVGEGGMQDSYRALAQSLGVEQRIHFLGHTGHEHLRKLYANCLAVFFGPHDEDYGYITLEAMLSSKPVITCTDSGGPLEFVLHDQTGLIVPPEAQALASAISELAANPDRARRMGRDARAHYEALDIRWEHVVDTLMKD